MSERFAGRQRPTNALTNLTLGRSGLDFHANACRLAMRSSSNTVRRRSSSTRSWHNVLDFVPPGQVARARPLGSRCASMLAVAAATAFGAFCTVAARGLALRELVTWILVLTVIAAQIYLLVKLLALAP